MFPTGFNPNVPSFGYGWASPATAPAAPGFGGYPAAGMTISFPNGGFGAEPAIPAERFMTSMTGGVMLDKDGAPAGRVPENSFVDLKSGSVYGPDGKAIALPEGGSVDFFDLPDISEMSKAYAGTTTSTDGGGKTTEPTSKYPMYPQYPTTAVNGQWGPGGVTDFKGGGTTVGQAGCDHHGAGTHVGGAKGPGAKGGGYGMPGYGGGLPGLTNTVAGLQQQVAAALGQLNALGVNTGMPNTMVGGAYGAGPIGPMNALGGYGHLGMHPGRLEHSLNELIFVLRDLVSAMQATEGGGVPAQTNTTQTSESSTKPSDSTTGTSETSTTDSSDTSTDTSTTATGSGTSTSTDDDTSTDSGDSSGTSTSADTSTT